MASLLCCDKVDKVQTEITFKQGLVNCLDSVSSFSTCIIPERTAKDRVPITIKHLKDELGYLVQKRLA